MDTRELRDAYRRLARWYDLAEALPEILGIGRLRRRMLARARGNVLEVAAGTGKNFRFYPARLNLVAVDLSAEMLQLACRRAAQLHRGYRFALMDAAGLAFPDRSFDTVVSTLSTCTFPEPVRALREISRVCCPDGCILLIEHGRSDRAWAARRQDRHAEAHERRFGCQWNREPIEMVREAGLSIVQAARHFAGIFHTIEARPG